MRLIGLGRIEAGQKLAMPVVTTSGKNILNAGVVLTEAYIRRLEPLKVSKVYIHDARFDDIVVYNPLDWETKRFTSLVINDTLINIKRGKEIDEYIIKDAAQRIVNYVTQTKSMCVSLLNLNAVDEYIVEHSINVGILSAFIGKKLKFNYNQLYDLVAGALIHDIARENIKDEKPEHAKKGFDIIRKCGGLNLTSAIVSYEHHENFDGSGYPRKLKGDAISKYARIVRVADEYDNALRGKYNDDLCLMPHQAYEILLALSAKALDPHIVEAFRDVIIFYPNGCSVALNNGFEGVVVRQNSGSPQRPVIRSFSLDEVDLVKSLTLLIDNVLVA